MDDVRREIQKYGTLEKEYAHYNFVDMHEDELTRPDRVEVIEMLRRVVMSQAILESWSLSDRTLTITVSDNSLTEIKEIVMDLQKESIVKSCNLDSYKEYAEGDVRRLENRGNGIAQLTVTLNPREEVGWQ